MPSLFVIQGRDQGTRFELDEPPCAIGRVGDNLVQLHDTEVSREHARVVREGEELVLEDLKSSNGTYVNGKPIRSHTLRTGDQIQMGRTLMLFTGAMDDALAADSQVDIIASRAENDGSRILHSISQSEGSELLATPADQTQSPWLARARSNLQIMYRTALAVSHTLDIDELLSRIMDMIFEWVDADRGCILLRDEQTGELQTRVRRHRRGPGAGAAEGDSQVLGDDGDTPDAARIAISQTILDYVVNRREGVLTSNARNDERWDPAQSIVKLGVREAICVPMQGRYDLVGVIYIDTSLTAKEMIQQGAANKFGQEHLKLMVAIAHQAALAVEDTSYRQAMVQAERLAAVGQTIATLSHHIKNILQGVRGGSYLIELGMKEHAKAVEAAGANEGEATQDKAIDGAIDAAAAAKAVATIGKGWSIVEKNQDRISGLVMDMLTYSKEREPEPVEAELNEVAADVVELMATRAGEAGVDLRWEPTDQLPTMHFDPEALHRAILNIVANAVDACESLTAVSLEEDQTDGFAREPAREAVVTVSTRLDADRRRAQLVVQDTGGGISSDDLEKIFTVFVSNKGGRGTGLGLPVTQKIVQEHGGTVLVSSTPGEGSRFTIELPLSTPTASDSAGGDNPGAGQAEANPAANGVNGDDSNDDSQAWETLVNPSAE